MLEIPAGTNPGSIVFVRCDAHGLELDRFMPTDETITCFEDAQRLMGEYAAKDADYQLDHPGSFTVIFDGDSGTPLMAFGIGMDPPEYLADDNIMRA